MPHKNTVPVIPQEALVFLSELAANNSTAWFAEQKERYEHEVRQPLLRTAEALAPTMAALDPLLRCDPASVVSRIRRDVRFSRDKSPFRTTLWLAFKRRSKEWTSRPAFFMEIGPELFRHGMGFYSAGTRGMAALRELAAQRPDAYAAALKRALGAGYELAGEQYKRPRPPEGAAEFLRELYCRRNVYLFRSGEPAEALENPLLAGMLGKCFSAAAPLYHLWLEAANSAAAAPAE